jgi:hypothetical protein
MLELLLVILIAGVALTVTSLAWLGRSVPAGTPMHAELFTSGDIPPYNFVVTLRARFFLPWVAAPDLSKCRSAPAALLAARVGAMLAFVSLIAMLIGGFTNVWA